MKFQSTWMRVLLAAVLPLTALTAPAVYSEVAAETAPVTEAPEAPPAELPVVETPDAAPATQVAETPREQVEEDDMPVPAAQGQDAQEAGAIVRDALVRDVSSAQEVLRYKQDIQAIESSEGAYAGRLSESLLSLGLKLQAQGRHDEAVKVFRRGVHLARINEGLYCVQQIPLLQAEIVSYVAERNYAAADERQNYLYRVQTRSVTSGEELAAAYMQQAKWQRDAFELGLEQDGHTRLMQMSDLYQLALQDVIAREGDNSPKLLPPLYGMLQAQYLISSYDVAVPMPTFGDQPYIDESLVRFKSYRAQSYQQGNAIIEAISGINASQPTPDSRAIAETLVMLGDWRLWNGKTDAAWEAYREAETELANSADAETLMPKLFGEPVALPNLGDLNPLPPAVAPENADVMLEFGVNERGRVQDIERLDAHEAEDRRAFRLMKQLRQTTFRPRFEAGKPVETEKLVKAFDVE
jgi:tetratricopeptide (TPR) repeat protein